MSVEIVFPFEVWVPGVPVSLQASSQSRDRWKARIEVAARNELPDGHFLAEMPISVTIYYFSDAPMEGDLDNIVKPILDSLSKVVYLDDSQVERILVRKFEPGRLFSFRGPSPTLSDAIDEEGPRVYLQLDLSNEGDVL
jgi:crossover junction endodeoxyribonuclease RusA